MNKMILNDQLVKKVKDQLDVLCPHATKVDVEVQKVFDDRYRTKITVDAPSQKILVATKVSEYATKSIEQASNAMMSQLHKLKTKRLARTLARRTKSRIELNEEFLVS